MKTSVLSVTYDGEKTENIVSFFHSINNQILKPDEVVLVIDGDIRKELNDKILEWTKIINNIRVLKKHKEGLSKGLNFGLQNCSGEIIFRCDTDDVSHPNRFKVQYEILINSDISITSSFIEEIYRNKVRRIKKVPVGLLNKNLIFSFFRNPVNHNSVAYKKNAIIEAGMYPSGRMEDFRLWINALKKGKKIYNSNKMLLIASADGIEKRRTGKDYFLSEIELFKLNSFRFPPFGILLSSAALLFRAPFRLPFMSYAIKYLYLKIFRKKIIA